MNPLPNRSPEPTAVGTVMFRYRGSRRESAVAQLSTLGGFERTMKLITEYWKKSPAWTKILFIIIVVPGTIAVSRIALEGSYPKLTAKLILILVLTICSWPLMFKSRGKRK